mmetsp:Transcript_22476/g.31258  ORF Transcript_22476/g.31258 Transcript_22476/m.31258 type:complete len:620 (-) Transcript_22476:249-2108(-)|eukprot:CAMPEP_0196588766 /NCGR_PEP_ID=MMETSP1081-20130531/61667_1 /TAXON_ID=36882 /ORGANISM="Pyramimonas amylifera, Strain CCMP720" /LENGTH=619 /DNA_ID=CAMNT_0041911373 /DNA_START=17 /DNA_END=1876 /DNA_ORIENTATION=-
MPWFCFPFRKKDDPKQPESKDTIPALIPPNTTPPIPKTATIVKLPESLQKVLEMSPYSMVASDVRAPDQPLVFINDRFLQHTGYQRSEVLGVNCRFMQGMETDHSTVSHIRECVENGKEFLGRLVNYSKDGEPMWNYLLLQPLHDNQGVLTHYTALQIFVAMDDDVQKALVAKELAMVASYVEEKTGTAMSTSSFKGVRASMDAMGGKKNQPKAPTRESFDTFHRDGEKRAEILVKELRDNLNKVTKTSKTMIMVIGTQDSGYPVLYASQHLLEETWLAEEEVLGANLTFLFGQPKSPEEVAAFSALTKAVQGGQQIRQRRWIRTRHDAILMLWGTLHLIPAFATDGSTPFYVGAFYPGPSPQVSLNESDDLMSEVVVTVEDWLKKNGMEKIHVRPSLDFGSSGPVHPKPAMAHMDPIQEPENELVFTPFGSAHESVEDAAPIPRKSDFITAVPRTSDFDPNLRTSIETSLSRPSGPLPPRKTSAELQSSFSAPYSLPNSSHSANVANRKSSSHEVGEEMNVDLEDSEEESECGFEDTITEEKVQQDEDRRKSVGLHTTRSRRQAHFFTLLPEKTMWIDLVHDTMNQPDAPAWGMSKGALSAIENTIDACGAGFMDEET